jgi:DNA-binding response OmpR family regulator
MSLEQRRPWLLLVEDEEQTLLAMQTYFTTQGFDVDCAQDQAQAEALIAASRYSMVLTDLRLTGTRGVEGLEIVSHVRRESPDTKVIILTAYGSPEVEAEARRRGADDFLYKSGPLSAVMGLILKHLAPSGAGKDMNR